MRKAKFIRCPMCDEDLPMKDNKVMHFASHAVKTDNGDYGWKCPCGEEDGFWPTNFGAAAGMTDHFARRHNISQTVSMGM
jgi:hypothetical protein